MGGTDWLETFKLIGGAIGMLALGMAAVFRGGKTEAHRPDGEGEVVMASFVERTLMNRLSSALERVADLMEAEAHRRELEAEVRRELRDRGINQ